MALRVFRTIDLDEFETIFLLEETLSGQSHAYTVRVRDGDGGYIDIDCICRGSANDLFGLLITSDYNVT